ncbi:CaiB/BaiF CoA transferase family protein [Acuticoccus kandeliae]|uniref:CaiB/BaiF CoA transferase family protein n=1 Tax=Acuticoccus kandeliae TaxID=2073160 RepID=UPI000D3EE135|nr:CoA transferase [Acuticoccus kandeliae]
MAEPAIADPVPDAGALGDLRVLELGSMLAGPFVGSLLGDFGAEVIKIEKPGKPDALREWPPHKGEVPLWWKTMARNKRLATLDLSNPGARDVALPLIGRADIVIENFRPGTMERWGFDPAVLAETFPHLIWVRVSGYGQTGPYAGRGGYATIAEAYSGLASFAGYADRGPMVSAFPMGDYLAGTFGAYGALAAVHARGRTGRGQVVDVSLFEPLLRIIESVAVRYDQTGALKPRLGNQMEEDVPRNIYATSDGHIAVSCGSQRIFENLLSAMDRLDLATDPRFGSMAARVEHRDAIDAIVGDWMKGVDTDTAEARLSSAGVVAGRVNDMAAVMDDLHIAARQAFATVADPDLGPVRMPAPVPRLSETPGRIKWAGKTSGADNDYVFRDILGLAPAKIAALSASGLI